MMATCLNVFNKKKHKKHKRKKLFVLPAGVYCDASFDEAESLACIAVVRVLNGDIIDMHRRWMVADGSNDAEAHAAKLAKELYPDEKIHTDNKHVAEFLKCLWLPREGNTLAHTVATKGMKAKRKPRFTGGRGVIPHMMTGAGWDRK